MEFLSKLSENLLEILDNDEEYYDTIIEVGTQPNVKIFRAHMVILNYRSSYLRRILSTNKKKDDETLTRIELPDILPDIFQILLRYIYGGRLSLDEYDDDISIIIKILIAANKLGLEELIKNLQKFLIENKTNWMEKNFNLIYKISFEDISFLELQKYCVHLIYNKPEKIFNSLNFSLISEKLLIILIQNSIKLNEIQIWEHMIKWGFSQHPEFSIDDPEILSKDDFNILKDTLKNCIPEINLYKLTPMEFSDKVLPYKKVLPKELYKSLVKYFLDQNSQNNQNNHGSYQNDQNDDQNSYQNDQNDQNDQFYQNNQSYQNDQNDQNYSNTKGSNYYSVKNIDSKIISSRQAELILKWVDNNNELTPSSSSPSYEFELLTRGTRPKKFHQTCDNKSNTITIIKIENSNEILGGYNPIEWKSIGNNNNNDDDFGNTKNSFIFSFKNKDNIENYILSNIKDEIHAIYNKPQFGPSFGYWDIYLSASGKNSYCRKNSYEKSIRETTDFFNVEEYEVFQII